MIDNDVFDICIWDHAEAERGKSEKSEKNKYMQSATCWSGQCILWSFKHQYSRANEKLPVFSFRKNLLCINIQSIFFCIFFASMRLIRIKVWRWSVRQFLQDFISIFYFLYSDSHCCKKNACLCFPPFLLSIKIWSWVFGYISYLKRAARKTVAKLLVQEIFIYSGMDYFLNTLG